MPRAARTRKADEPQFFEATTSIASEWIEQHALSEFPGGVVRQGTIVRADHPILKAHAQFFEPVRAHMEPREAA
jgi:hypothetical protein